MGNIKKIIIFSSFFCSSISVIAKEKDYSVVDINDYWNKSISYKEEIEKEDRWQTPKETFSLKYGDCEDYAIAKYFHLLSKGINPEKLNLAVVLLKDPFREDKKIKTHAVLLYENNNKKYVLDNYSQDIIELEKRTDIVKMVSVLNHSEAVISTPKATQFVIKWKKIRTNFNEHVEFMKTIKSS